VGLSYRKSFKAGPIRITASKSGISYSAGVKGARVTKRADGRVQTTLSAPGTGLRYTATAGSKGRQQRSAGDLPVHQQQAADPAIQAAYLALYADSVQRIRDGAYTGDELRAGLYEHGVTHPEVVKAVADAERHLANEDKWQASQNAAAALAAHIDALVAEAAQMLRDGARLWDVDAELRRGGLDFMGRGKALLRAKWHARK
jgi:hypothetical protein